MHSNPAGKLHALFGGTFDPIHYGHLQVAETLAKQAGLQQVILLPNHIPPHRPQPEATPQQRLAMITLAIAGKPLFHVDSRELQSTAPSYAVNTLEMMRREQGPSLPMAFIIGQDVLHAINTWYRWESLLNLCHLLVCTRPGYSETLNTPELRHWLNSHRTDKVAELSARPHGYIWFAQTPLVDICATEIRKRCRQGLGCHGLVPEAVRQYIEQYQLYR